LQPHLRRELGGLPIGPATPIHVTAPSQRSAASDVVFHRGSIPPDEVTEIDGIPVTTTARTLLDLASCIPLHRLRALVHEVEYRQLTDPVPLSMLVDRYPGRRGLAAVRAILAEGIDGDSRTREELEARFRQFLIERDIPPPRFNHPMAIGSMQLVADCVWIGQRVIVELDGAAAHSRRANFEADRKRDRRLLVAGWRPTRVTWRQLAHDADELERELRALLAETRVSDG
jgi:very-short-patch-repair endonuclease